VELEDCLTTRDVRPIDHDLPVEAPRSQQRGIEHLGPVRGCHHDDALAGVEAVHLCEQLVERLLALFVGPGGRGHPRLPERVELVDEHDAGSSQLGLSEEVAHARGAHADEHLDELGAGHAEERHARFTGDGAGEQRLAGAWRPEQQHALGKWSAEIRVLLRVLQEVDHLPQLFRRLVDARDVSEAHLDIVFGVDSRGCARRPAPPRAGPFS
jgi:hypothetical protein